MTCHCGCSGVTGKGRFWRGAHPGYELLARRGVRVPAAARPGEAVLQPDEGNDVRDRRRRHPCHRQLISRLIDGRFGRCHASAGDADQKSDILRAQGSERHGPTRLADPQQPKRSSRQYRAASSKTRQRRPRRPPGPREGGRIPVAGRFADAPFVETEQRDAVTNQDRAQGSMYARFSGPEPWTRTMAGCLPPVDGAINVPVNCTSRFVNRTSSRVSIVDPFRSPRGRTVMLPRERGYPAGAVALKCDAGLDRGGQCGAGTGEELVAVGRIQRAHITRLVKRDQLGLAESTELVPHLHVDETVRFPLVDARVLTKNGFVKRAGRQEPDAPRSRRARRKGWRESLNRSAAADLVRAPICTSYRWLLKPSVSAPSIRRARSDPPEARRKSAKTQGFWQRSTAPGLQLSSRCYWPEAL